MTADAILSKLRGVQGRGPRWRAICPAHQSKHGTRTLAIFEADDGRVLIKCHAGCDVGEIVGAVGMDLSDLFPPRVSDDQRKPRIRKPWAARDVVAGLQAEAMVGALLLFDIGAGKVLTASDKARAKLAAERMGALIRELTEAA